MKVPFNGFYLSHIFTAIEISLVKKEALTLVLLNLDLSRFENTVDPDQLASEKAI